MKSPSWLRRMQLRYAGTYYNFVFAVAGRGLSMFNFGYAPISAMVEADAEAAKEPYQAELYAQVWCNAGLDQTAAKNALVVEISSGMGGGLAFVQRLSGARVIGLERSSSGRRAGVRRGLEVRDFEAPILDLHDGSVDVILNIEAAHNYFTPEFAQVIARVLRPGGVLTMADCPLGKFESVTGKVEGMLVEAGLRVERIENVTQNAIDAMRADTPRKMRFIRWCPKALRLTLMEALGCEPSNKLDSFIDGSRGYYLLRAIKPDAENL